MAALCVEGQSFSVSSSAVWPVVGSVDLLPLIAILHLWDRVKYV